jgi:hypothetical protein
LRRSWSWLRASRRCLSRGWISTFGRGWLSGYRRSSRTNWRRLWRRRRGRGRCWTRARTRRLGDSSLPTRPKELR